jgi:hypothetical protein
VVILTRYSDRIVARRVTKIAQLEEDLAKCASTQLRSPNYADYPVQVLLALKIGPQAPPRVAPLSLRGLVHQPRYPSFVLGLGTPLVLSILPSVPEQDSLVKPIMRSAKPAWQWYYRHGRGRLSILNQICLSGIRWTQAVTYGGKEGEVTPLMTWAFCWASPGDGCLRA